ncbi:MAG TPA: protein kinase [Pyrinomonadaceae bacterium]|nr:protein kinase [Pyrinomonadaceae bacterium]
MIGRTISHYRILSQLGEGGMGVVYVAEDTNLGRRVALKVPTAAAAKNYRARFLREARAVSALSHPHIAAVYDYGETTDGQPFIVMELVSGSTLGDLLLSSALTISRAVEIVEDVAGALAEAHGRGIIHRDIKPSNILINDRGEVKVLDFGLAKQLEAESVYDVDPEAKTLLSTQTRSNVIVGTPLYLSPEQARGAKVDRRSDLFALGALLYECLAGRPAFSGANVIEIGAQVLHVDPAPPSKFNPRVPAELNRITLKALAKKPESRYQSAEEFADDLRAVGTKLSKTDAARTRRITTQSMPVRSSALMTLSETLRRPRLSPAAFVAALIAVLLGVWAYGWLRAPSPHEPRAEAVKWYERGTDALRSGAYYQASKEFEQAVREDEKFALAHARLAEAWGELDYADRAAEEILRAKRLVPDSSALSPLDALYLDAVTSTVVREFANSVKSYEGIKRLAPDEPHVYLDLGRAYEKAEDVKRAIESYVEATNRDPQYAAAFLRLGILYGRQQELASAASAFSKAEALYEAQGNTEGLTEALFQRGFLANKNDQIAEARQPLQKALEMARGTNNRYQQAQILLKLSNVAFTATEWTEARALAREAIEMAQTEEMDNLTARGHIELGNIHLVRREYADAENFFRQALHFAQRIKARRAETFARISLGSVLMSQDKVDEALPHLTSALDYFEQGGFRTEAAQARRLIGRAQRQKGDYAAALKMFDEQLRLAQQANSPAQIAQFHEETAWVLVHSERYPEAVGHFAESYAINKSSDNQLFALRNLVDRGHVLWQLGRYDEARAALSQVSSAAAQPDDRYKSLRGWLNLTSAQMALSERQFVKAREKARSALELSSGQGTGAIVEAQLTLGLASALSGRKTEGESLCKEALTAATKMNHLRLLNAALLARAQVLLESGDTAGAISDALRARDNARRAGQRESEWRASLVTALAYKSAGDTERMRESAARAAEALANLHRSWGAEDAATYFVRPDVLHLRKQLDAILAEN